MEQRLKNAMAIIPRTDHREFKPPQKLLENIIASCHTRGKLNSSAKKTLSVLIDISPATEKKAKTRQKIIYRFMMNSS